MPFECDIPVRFGHVDQARIVYYPWFFHFCHEAMERMFEVVAKTTYADVLNREKLGFPAVHIETDFHETVGLGETLRMAVSVESVGRTSLRLRFEGRRASDGVVALRASITTVCCDMDRFAPVPIPEKYRVAFATIPAERPSA